jgi:hypothetical protein
MRILSDTILLEQEDKAYISSVTIRRGLMNGKLILYILFGNYMIAGVSTIFSIFVRALSPGPQSLRYSQIQQNN